MKVNKDLWENDASLIPKTAVREDRINHMRFDYHKHKGHTPEQAFPKEEKLRKLYAEFLIKKDG